MILKTTQQLTTRVLLKLAIFLSLALSSIASFANASKKIELETLKIQGNKELPKMLFIVPWKSEKGSSSKDSHQKLVLHSLYGDLFDPVTPNLDKKSLKKRSQVKKILSAP